MLDESGSGSGPRGLLVNAFCEHTKPCLHLFIRMNVSLCSTGRLCSCGAPEEMKLGRCTQTPALFRGSPFAPAFWLGSLHCRPSGHEVQPLMHARAAAGDGYNRTVKGAAVLAPLEYQSPMEIFPGAIFRYRPCAAGAPVAYLRADLMAVPSTRHDNASAYAIHTWTRVRCAHVSPFLPVFCQYPRMPVSYHRQAMAHACMKSRHAASEATLHQAAVQFKQLSACLLNVMPCGIDIDHRVSVKRCASGWLGSSGD